MGTKINVIHVEKDFDEIGYQKTDGSIHSATWAYKEKPEDSETEEYVLLSAYEALQKRVAELEIETNRLVKELIDVQIEHPCYRLSKELETENKKLRDALSKFSDPNFYWTKPPTVEDGWIVYGRAKKTAELLNAARQALGEVGE